MNKTLKYYYLVSVHKGRLFSRKDAKHAKTRI